VPVLAVAGEGDRRYAAIAERTAAAIGATARAALVAGAGHSAHLEQPERFTALLLDWLERTIKEQR
jgi:pimeloyl-ACP methyl ester carboxylesterase